MVQRILFGLYGCPLCEIAAEAIVEVNQQLTPSEKIIIEEVFPLENNKQFVGSPNLRIAAKWYGSMSITEGQWGFPLLIVDNPAITRKFDDFTKGIRQKAVIEAAYSKKQYVAFLEHYLT